MRVDLQLLVLGKRKEERGAEKLYDYEKVETIFSLLFPKIGSKFSPDL
jgi:hypothetical protein